MAVTLTVHDSQYPQRVSEQLRHGLRARRLPGKFLYDSPAQAQRWLAYHQAYAPSRTAAAVLDLYQQAFQAALRALASPQLHYVSLGCGGGMKDALCLTQAIRQGAPVLFTPMDASVALVLETLLRVQPWLADLTTAPLVVDFDSRPDLSAWLAQHETPRHRRLLGCFGMLSNVDYRSFLPYIRSLMRPGDLVLLSANLSPGLYAEAVGRILPQYDNPYAHAWYTGALTSLGLALEQMRLSVQPHLLRPDGHLWQIQAVAVIQQALQLVLDGEHVALSAGESIDVFFSNRFTPEVMPEVLAESGLTLLESWLWATHEEGLYLCARSSV